MQSLGSRGRKAHITNEEIEVWGGHVTSGSQSVRGKQQGLKPLLPGLELSLRILAAHEAPTLGRISPPNSNS